MVAKQVSVVDNIRCLVAGSSRSPKIYVPSSQIPSADLAVLPSMLTNVPALKDEEVLVV